MSAKFLHAFISVSTKTELVWRFVSESDKRFMKQKQNLSRSKDRKLTNIISHSSRVRPRRERRITPRSERQTRPPTRGKVHSLFRFPAPSSSFMRLPRSLPRGRTAPGAGHSSAFVYACMHVLSESEFSGSRRGYCSG